MDELGITKDEELEILEWDDGDGWCRGRNKAGKDGYFPQSYVQSIPNTTSRSSSPYAMAGNGQNSIASVSTSMFSSSPPSHLQANGTRT